MSTREYYIILNKILKRQELADLSQYSTPGFFDEIPLYSRFREVKFLEKLRQEDADKVLIGFGLQYLDSIVQQIEPTPLFFAALTFLDFPEDDYLVPNIFVCNGEVHSVLGDKLILRQPRGQFSTRINKAIKSLNLISLYSLKEDPYTVRECMRVFVGHRVSLRQSMLTIYDFYKRNQDEALRNPG